MVKASDLINLVKIQLSNWNVSRNEDALIQYLNMGLSDVYEKFNLNLKTETVPIIPEQTVYDLKGDDVNLILNIYDEQGRELNSSDVISSVEWDYKLVNYKTFVFHNKDLKEGLLYVLYKAAPIQVVDTNDILDIPNAFKEALMLYMMYLGTATIHSEASNEYRSWDTKSVFYTLYSQKCAELLQQGYKMPIDSEGMPIYARGYK